MFKVLLANIENWDSISEVPSLLKKAGCIVDVLCSDDSWSISNSYFDNWIPCINDPEIFKNKIIQFAEEEQYDWIILGDDSLLKLMNEFVNDEKLFQKILPLTKIENRDLLGSKAGFSNICEKYKILTPNFLVYENQSVEFICSKISFPMLLKEDLSWSGLGIVRCDNENELRKNLELIEDKSNLVIQKYIDGDDVGVEALFKDGQLIMVACSKILTYMNGDFGVTTRRIYYANKEIETKVIELGELIGINGFANLAYMFDDLTDQYYLIEIDLRLNSWFAYGKFAGCDFVDGIKQFLNPDSKVLSKNYATVKQSTEIALFYKDIRRSIIAGDYANIFAWLFNLNGYWKFIPFYDTVLLKKYWKEWKPLISKRIKRKFFKS